MPETSLEARAKLAEEHAEKLYNEILTLIQERKDIDWVDGELVLDTAFDHLDQVLQLLAAERD